MSTEQIQPVAPMHGVVMTPEYQPANETLAGFAWRVIDDIFRYGTEEQKQDCLKSFYSRVFWEDAIELSGIYGGAYAPAFVLVKDGIKYHIEAQDWKFRVNGKAIKDANLADMLGVPVAFLDGLAMATAFCHKLVGTKKEQEDATKAFLEERRKLEATRRALDKKLTIGNAGSLGRKAVVKSLRRAAEKEIAKNQINAGVAAAEQKFWAEITKRCTGHDMPPVPRPTMKRSQIRQLPPFSGLYFEWDGLLCNYVGKSINVPARLNDGHHKLQGDSMMSFLQMDSSVIGRNELFYIWLLNPAKNGGLD
jgi:hypothetical protein